MPVGTLFRTGRRRREWELGIFTREVVAELQGICLPSVPLGALPFLFLNY